MIDKFHELYSSLEKRLKSPLFGSFAATWLIVNWRIMFAIFDEKIVSSYGCETIVQFIESQSWWRLIFWPFILTFVYLFAIPPGVNVIKAFDAWIKKWGYSWVVSISKEGAISLVKYLKHRENYEELSKSLSEIINNDSVYQEQVEVLINEKADLFDQLQKLNFKLNDLLRLEKLEPLNGEWTYIDGSGEKEVVVKDGDFSSIYDNLYNKFNMFSLKDGHVNTQKKSLSGYVQYATINDSQAELEDYFFLYYNDDYSTFWGKIGRYEVEMNRKS